MRAENWEVILDNALRAARGLPFVWGESDCFMWASDTSAAMGGPDFAAALGLRGSYDSKESGMRRVAETWGNTDAMMDSVLERHAEPRFAQRGDVVLYDAFGFGIVDLSGRRIVARDELGGMKGFPLAVALAAWRIG